MNRVARIIALQDASYLVYLTWLSHRPTAEGQELLAKMAGRFRAQILEEGGTPLEGA